MRHIIDSFTTHVPATNDTPERDIQVFITDIVFDYKDKAVLKHLANSDINIHEIPDIAAAYALAERLMATDRLVTSQKDVNIRYKKWSLSKKSESENSSKPCEEPSIGPEQIYNEKVTQAIIKRVIAWCKTRKFQSFITFSMLETCIAKAIYGESKQDYDEQQMAVIRFAKERFTERYCIKSPFNNKGYNLGSELMSIMYPNGVKYRTEQYVKNTKPTYYIIKGNTITNTKTGKTTIIPNSTFGERNPIRTQIDTNLYYSKAA